MTTVNYTMKIYTRTGDDGSTALFAGGRVNKAHLRVETYGTVDELNSMLGRARSSGALSGGWLAKILTHLFHLGADRATPL
jgi:cob(I)alamin adenosyltransferase